VNLGTVKFYRQGQFGFIRPDGVTKRARLHPLRVCLTSRKWTNAAPRRHGKARQATGGRSKGPALVLRLLKSENRPS
jgi:hypothetical protein